MKSAASRLKVRGDEPHLNSAAFDRHSECEFQNSASMSLPNTEHMLAKPELIAFIVTADVDDLTFSIK